MNQKAYVYGTITTVMPSFGDLLPHSPLLVETHGILLNGGEAHLLKDYKWQFNRFLKEWQSSLLKDAEVPFELSY